MPDTSQLDINEMLSAADDAAALMRCLSHKDRLLLLCQLSQQEMCVSELEEMLAIRQPSLSQHLGILRRQGLIVPRRDGKHIYYQIGDERALAVLQTLYQQFCQQAKEETS